MDEVMRGSSMDRHDRRRKRERLNGALRGKVEGEAGSAVWLDKLSEELLWPDLLCAQRFWSCTATGSVPSGVLTVGDARDGLAWKSPSEMERERRSRALLPPVFLEESLIWHGTPQGLNLNSKRLFSMHVSAAKEKKQKWKIKERKTRQVFSFRFLLLLLLFTLI